MNRISAAVITFNEEAKIGRALGSLSGIADEIIVVDSGSVDRTTDIASELGARVVRNEWPGYREQKQFAADLAVNDWVLSLDADEEVSPELAAEILAWKNEEPGETAGYYLPRITFFMGRWIRHTTWYPDLQLRLFRKSRGRWEGGRVHEGFRARGETSAMSGHLRHYTYSNVSEYLEQLENFSSLAAADYVDRGKKAGIPRLIFSPPLVFFKNYVLKAGFLDGKAGFAVSSMAAVSTFFKLMKTEELIEAGRNMAATRMPDDP